MAKIAFIGLGNMGTPMVRNLIRAGHDVVVHDLLPEAMQRLAESGATAAASAAEAAVGAEYVISMLPAGEHVRSLYMDEGHLLEAADHGATLIDCSTIAPDEARALNEAAAKRGIAMIDAPVSGGVGGAEKGTLTFICGGAQAAVEHARPVLENMGKAVFHAGPAGAGQVGKMCNNMLLAIQMIGTSEALNLGTAYGLDPAALSEIMKASSGSNWTLQVYNPFPGVMDEVPAARGYQGGFLVDLMTKDLGLAMHMALQKGTTTPLGAAANSLYRLHGAAGNGGRDFSSILQFLAGNRLD